MSATRWLEIARRAMEYRSLQQQRELADRRAERDQAQRDLESHRRELAAIGEAWRQHLQREDMQPAVLDAYRRHALQGAVLEAEHVRTCRQAEDDARAVEDGLRRHVHQSHALESLLDQRLQQEAQALDRQLQREANERWAARSAAIDGKLP